MDKETERKQQQKLHEAITDCCDLEDDEIVTSWIVCYAVVGTEGSSAGHFYGPAQVTPWDALGLLEYVKHKTLFPDNEDEEDDE